MTDSTYLNDRWFPSFSTVGTRRGNTASIFALFFDPGVGSPQKVSLVTLHQDTASTSEGFLIQGNGYALACFLEVEFADGPQRDFEYCILADEEVASFEPTQVWQDLPLEQIWEGQLSHSDLEYGAFIWEELRAQLDEFRVSNAQSDLELYLECVIERAIEEWIGDIHEPSSSEIEAINTDENPDENWPTLLRGGLAISQYVVSCGPEWENILSGREGVIKYRRDAWCGYFAGFCMLNPSGDTQYRLAADIGHYVMPSCTRLDSEGKWSQAGFESFERLEPQDIQRGDVCTVKTSGKKPYGDHIVLALGLPNEDGDYPTMEGNANGRKPTGSDDRQGVVFRTRHIDDTRRVYRVSEQHLESY